MDAQYVMLRENNLYRMLRFYYEAFMQINFLPIIRDEDSQDLMEKSIYSSQSDES